MNSGSFESNLINGSIAHNEAKHRTVPIAEGFEDFVLQKRGMSGWRIVLKIFLVFSGMQGKILYNPKTVKRSTWGKNTNTDSAKIWKFIFFKLINQLIKLLIWIPEKTKPAHQNLEKCKIGISKPEIRLRFGI